MTVAAAAMIAPAAWPSPRTSPERARATFEGRLGHGKRQSGRRPGIGQQRQRTPPAPWQQPAQQRQPHARRAQAGPIADRRGACGGQAPSSIDLGDPYARTLQSRREPIIAANKPDADPAASLARARTIHAAKFNQRMHNIIHATIDFIAKQHSRWPRAACAVTIAAPIASTGTASNRTCSPAPARPWKNRPRQQPRKSTHSPISSSAAIDR